MVTINCKPNKRFPPKVLLGSFSTITAKQIRKGLKHRVIISGETYLGWTSHLPLAALEQVDIYLKELRLFRNSPMIRLAPLVRELVSRAPCRTSAAPGTLVVYGAQPCAIVCCAALWFKFQGDYLPGTLQISSGIYWLSNSNTKLPLFLCMCRSFSVLYWDR